ncbi:MAG: hypothetical protein DDT33_00846 [Firmicutes bacterium]|nr:hypothetical protein [Bacillota bacterium]
MNGYDKSSPYISLTRCSLRIYGPGEDGQVSGKTAFKFDRGQFYMSHSEHYTSEDFKKVKGRVIPLCEVKDFNGTPTIFIEGRPLSGMAFWSLPDWDDVNKKMGGTGIVLFTPQIPLGWNGPGKFDYQSVDSLIQCLLKAAPNTLLIPRLELNAPIPWQKENPEELCLYHDAPRDMDSVKNIFSISKHDPAGYQEGQFSSQSFASERWKEDAREALLRFLDHVTLAPYASRIIGYHLTFGISGESQLWGGWAGKFADYSEPMRRAFGKWLQAKYGGDIKKLREVWKEEVASFEKVQIPSKEERLQTSLGVFRNSDTEAKVIDYHEFMSVLTSNDVLFFAKALKEATSNRVLCGVFYGYILECIWDIQHTHMQNTGHLKVKKVLDSPFVDFLSAPTTYCKRSIGEAGGCMSVINSIVLHGKLWFNEADIRTNMSSPDANFGRVATAEHTTAVLRREFAYILTNRANLWWMDQGNGWFSSPVILKDLAQLKNIADDAIRLERKPKPVSEGIAVIVDDRTFCHTTLTNELFRPLIYTQRDLFARIGAPYHLYLLDDLSNPGMPDYKMYIFLNTFYMDAHQRVIVAKKVKQNGNFVVWVYAPGFLIPNPDINALSEMTGMRMLIANEDDSLEVEILDVKHPITDGLNPPYTFGTKDKITPKFYVNDPDAISLGKLPKGKTGLAIKKMDGWSSVYIIAPNIPPALLRNIAKLAGVHIYFDQDQVLYVDEHFISIHTNRDVEGVLHLPKKANVYDIYAGKLVSQGENAVFLKLPANTTVMYQLQEPLRG